MMVAYRECAFAMGRSFTLRTTTLPFFLRFASELLRPLSGKAKPCVSCRHTCVNRNLQQRFLQIAGFELVLKSGANVHAELFPTAESRHNNQHHQAPRANIQSGTRPDSAPGVARNHLLEVAIEISGCG